MELNLEVTFDEKGFSGQVPLFPLPNLVLLPGCLLPLHVFEHRYRDMSRDSIQGERLLGIATLKPGYEENYNQSPEVREQICIARIVHDERMPDGRYNLVVLGLQRARILAEDRSRSYRVAQVNILKDSQSVQGAQLQGQVRSLVKYLTRLPPQQARNSRRLLSVVGLLQQEIPSHLLGPLVDAAASAVHMSLPEQLVLFETLPVLERLLALNGLLRARLGGRHFPSWPPRFSRN